VKKPRIDNCKDEGENASNTNESELSKSAEGGKGLSLKFKNQWRHLFITVIKNNLNDPCLNKVIIST
jgi:hypothetical protein